MVGRMTGKAGGKSGDHGWTGGGRFRVARIDGALVLWFAGLSSRGGRLKSDIGAFFRKDYRTPPADFGAYDVRIWIETGPDAGRRIDADNVAKACLDALTGIVWKDDNQVVRLTVEKLPAEGEAITLAVRPVDRPTENSDLDGLRAAVEALP